MPPQHPDGHRSQLVGSIVSSLSERVDRWADDLWRAQQESEAERYARAVQQAKDLGKPMPWTQGQLDRVLDGREIGEKLDLAWVNLEGLDLRGRCLSKANLRDTRLVDARLDGANLQGADLKEANLHGATLRKTGLEWACMDRCVLTGADLSESRLFHAHLRCADVDGAVLRQVEAMSADFTGADLSDTDLRGAKLAHTKLEKAQLPHARLTGASLIGADLAGANLHDADLEGVDLSSLVEGGLSGVRLSQAKLDQTDMRLKQLDRIVLEERQKQYEDARQVYLVLKRNFESLGDYRAAAELYVKERRMERATHAPRRVLQLQKERHAGRRAWTLKDRIQQLSSYIRHSCLWVGDWVQDLVTGFGENPWRTLCTLVLTYFVFSTGYWLTWSVMTVEHNAGSTVYASTRNLWEVLLFSLGALTTITSDALRPATSGVEFAMSIEALLGILLTGLLGFVLGNRIRRS